MKARRRFAPLFSPSGALLPLLMLALTSSAGLADPVLGFRETFPGISTGSWGGGTLFSNPGSGGYLGPLDGYLRLESALAANFGSVAFGPEYTGNWTAAGVTQVRLWLNDVGTDEAFEVHFSIGNGDQLSPTKNFWQYNVGFMPPLHAWGEFIVDLTSADWTQILGTGSLATALTIVNRIHLRHDKAPYLMIPNPPDPIAGDLGIDHILLTNGLVGVEPFAPRAGRPVELAAPFPNPSRGPVTLSVRVAEPGAVTLQIVDVAGRSVRRVELPDAGAGPRTWMWDGRDDRGQRVPAGVYRARAFGASGGTSRPLVRVD